MPNSEEQKLYKELTKLVKTANQRILRLERETRIKHPFAVKQLYDYIDTFAITKKGRIRVSSKWDVRQMKIVQKAVSDFMKSDFSRAGKVKKYRKQLEQEIGKKLTYKQANIIYESNKHYSWIYEYIPKSEFWGYWVKACNEYNWSRTKWVEEIADRIGHIPDEELKKDLIALYIYIKD